MGRCSIPLRTGRRLHRAMGAAWEKGQCWCHGIQGIRRGTHDRRPIRPWRSTRVKRRLRWGCRAGSSAANPAGAAFSAPCWWVWLQEWMPACDLSRGKSLSPLGGPDGNKKQGLNCEAWGKLRCDLGKIDRFGGKRSPLSVPDRSHRRRDREPRPETRSAAAAAAGR
jgi:hypothetical protein